MAASKPRPSCSAATQTGDGGVGGEADSQQGAERTIAGLRRELERSQNAVGVLKGMARQDTQVGGCCCFMIRLSGRRGC